MVSVVDTIRRLVGGPTSIDSVSALGEFIDSRAAFMAQKCVTEFCRVRAGVYWEKLFGEEVFQHALVRANWMSYTPALAMITEMIEGELRAASDGGSGDFASSLIKLASAQRSAKIVPPEVDESAWEAQSELVADQITTARGRPVRAVRFMPAEMAHLVHAALPMDRRLVAADYDYIFNNLRMNLLRAHEDFARRTSTPRLRIELAAMR